MEHKTWTLHTTDSSVAVEGRPHGPTVPAPGFPVTCHHPPRSRKAPPA